MVNVNILNGPNLNMLGKREAKIYGTLNLEDIKNSCLEEAKLLSYNLNFFQSNIEGEIINEIHRSLNNYDAIIINAGAYTHTSIAIRDALLTFDGSIIEVHISNIYARERFRHHSYISDIADGIIAGFGGDSYVLALRAIENLKRA